MAWDMVEWVLAWAEACVLEVTHAVVLMLGVEMVQDVEVEVVADLLMLAVARVATSKRLLTNM